MRKHLGLLIAGTAALAVSLGTAPTVRAEFFDYSTTVHIDPVTGVTVSSGQDSDTVVLDTSGGNTITVTGTSNAGSAFHYDASDPGTDLVFANIMASVDANTSAQDISFDFTYTVNITNFETETGGAPTGSGVFTVSGNLSGSIGAGRKVNLNNLMNYVSSPPSQVIGGVRYTLSLNDFTPPGPTTPGAFGGHLTATAVPEPVSVISTGLGFLGVAGLLARGRRRKRAAV